jgi:hypothetical protein
MMESTDIDIYPEKDNMHEPLISKACNAIKVPSTSYLHFLSFLTGSCMAVGSQILLSQIMWTTNLESTFHIVCFSLAWSFWTCLIVFLGMVGWGRLVQGRVQECETLLFQMEAHHIVGSLLSISLIWLLVDVLQATSFMKSAPRGPIVAALAVLGMVLWFPIMLCFVPNTKSSSASQVQEDTAQGLTSTYQLIGVTLGLITGLCSQFVLSFLLWRHDWMNNTTSVIIFSLLWSVTTVLWTAAGCASMKLIVQDSNDKERTFFRMESRYIVGSLIGICLAWMVMDWVYNVREKIFSCLLLLTLSLACFFMILACFPEEDCLASLREEQVETSEEPDVEQVSLVNK